MSDLPDWRAPSDGRLGQPRSSCAATDGDRKLVLVMLRGGLDGLAAVVPYGDRNLAELRRKQTPPEPGQPDGLLDLGGFFGLHPALPGLHDMFVRNQALLVHAVGGPHRTRSHFDAQDFLEIGCAHRLSSGWLNRLLAVLRAGENPAGAIAIGSRVPLALRGAIPVDNWTPLGWASPEADFYPHLLAMHCSDPLTGPALQAGLAHRGFIRRALTDLTPEPVHGDFVTLAKCTGHLLAARDAPCLATLDFDGWDTHVGQMGRLTQLLHQLDAGLMALRQGLGETWARTVVLVTTEFGRTARINGTFGTDHGTGSAAFLLGGQVAGGRLQAAWPGLGPGQLFEDRDLLPTTDVRGLIKGILAEHLGLSPEQLAEVFPESTDVAPVGALLGRSSASA